VLADPGLIDVARASADALWTPIVRGGFDRPSVTPYDVACAVYCLDRLAAVDDGSWRELADRARAWFEVVDGTGRAVYDHTSGRVADGVDDGRVSRNSGAEANLVAAEALPVDAANAVGPAVALLPP
jgi:hypothetical protein